MKTVVLFIAILISAVLHSQQLWCPLGAQWTYNLLVPFESQGYAQCTYEKDTIMLGILCEEISCKEVLPFLVGPHHIVIDTIEKDPVFTFSRNDSVFFFAADTGIFVPKYFFNAQVGDTVSYPSGFFNCSSESEVKQRIDSTGVIQINNQSLRYYVATVIQPDSTFIFTSKVVERMGIVDDNFLNPTFYCAFDLSAYGLRCYKDYAFPLYQTDPETDCGYLYLAINDVEQNEKASLFPNPTTNNCQLKLQQTPATETYFELFDAVSRLVKRERITDISTSISRTALNNGIYFWQLESGNVIQTRGKLIFE